MEFPIKFDIVKSGSVKSGWSIVYNFQNILLLIYVLANSANPESSLFSKVPVLGFWSSEG